MASLTCRLAEIVNLVETGPYARIQFNADQIKEIRYAAVLHDFGKVGVREHILSKAEKLYPAQQEAVKARFDFIKRTLEADTLRRKLEIYETNRHENTQALFAQLDQQLGRQIHNVDDMFSFVLKYNQPTSRSHRATPQPLPHLERLREIADQEYRSFDGMRPYLTRPEVQALSTTEGSLTREERRQIQQHVAHTFEFLSKIPWTKSLKNVPSIAWSHHEKLDGSGYPRGLKKDLIPIQASMMTICDIYDAMTAADRPCKSAIFPSEALRYLAGQVTEGKIDSVLFDLFQKERVYEATLIRLSKIA